MNGELVNQVVEQVIAMLRSQGVTVASSRPVEAAPPPATVQTGGPSASPVASATKPGKVFITAEMLEQRVKADDGNGAVDLAPYEFLTPNAMDVVDRLHLTVRKAEAPLARPVQAVSAPAPASHNPAPAGANPGLATTSSTPATGTIALALYNPDEKVRSVVTALKYDGLSLHDYNQTDCWIENLRLACQAVVDGSEAAGIAILPYAADAMLLANKITGVRAVQGTRPESVAAAVRHFGANMLILEHAVSTFHEMRSMIRRFACERPATMTAEVLLRHLGEVERA